MCPIAPSSGINRRALLSTLVLLPALCGLLLPASAPAQLATSSALLPSWNDGPAKQAILDFVRATTDRSSPSYVSFEDRIAVFDAGWHALGRASHVHASGLLPGTRSGGGGTFTQALYDEAKKDDWTVISMKNDWKRIFAFEQ